MILSRLNLCEKHVRHTNLHAVFCLTIRSRQHMRQKKKGKNRSKGLLIPECVCSEIALTPTSGFQFDKRPTSRIECAHEGNADAEYH